MRPRWYQQLEAQPAPVVLHSGSPSQPGGQTACGSQLDSPLQLRSQKQELWQLTPPRQLSLPSQWTSQGPAPQLSCEAQEPSSVQSMRQDDAWLQSISCSQAF